MTAPEINGQGLAGSPDEAEGSFEMGAKGLHRLTMVGKLWRAEGESGAVRCLACGHRCLIHVGQSGVCKVRWNDAGALRVPFGYVSGVQCDPIEKKPFFHVLPGHNALTFGMLGCNFHCSFCQNWLTSQSLRDPASTTSVKLASPKRLIEAALRAGARLVVSSYNEPLITAEWAGAVFAAAHSKGLACALVSNGHASTEVLDFLQPWLTACKIDLKSFDEKRYRTLGGSLPPVTETIRACHARGIWVEVVTLLVPGFNDDENELRALAGFLAGVSRDIPWHVTAFHKDYQMTGPRATTPQDLVRAAEIGRAEGLRFVYAGNQPGRVGAWENTRCPHCGETVIERAGYIIRRDRLTADGKCSKCQTPLPGRWR